MEKILRAFDLFFVIPIVVAIGLVSYLQITPQFSGNFTQHVGSIEVSFITMAEFIKDGWPNLLWNPNWYLGFPFQTFYAPLLPFLEVLGNLFFGWSFGHAYRVLTGIGYVLAPVSLFFLGWQITRTKFGGIIAAVAYATMPSLFDFIIKEVRDDKLTEILEPRRYTIWIRWGEGPNIFGLIFVPLAAAFFARALDTKRFYNQLLSSIFITLTALSNQVALFGCVLLLVSIFFSKIIKGDDKIESVFKISVQTALLTVGLSAFWYNQSFLGNFGKESGGALNHWLSIFPWGFIGLGLILGLYFYLLRKFTSKFEGIAVSLTFFLLTFPFIYIYYTSGIGGEDKIELIPQVLRLMTYSDMALSLIIASVLAIIFRFLWKSNYTKVFAVVIAVVTILPFIYWSTNLNKQMPQFTKPLESTGKKLEDFTEYKTAKKLESLEPGRVMVTGNYSFYLNYFTNIPQLNGGHYQSSRHPWADHIYYQLANDKDGVVSSAWMEIANLEYMVYTTDGSSEPFKDFKIGQEKFESFSSKIEEVNGDIYYKTNLKNPSLAQIVDISQMKELKKPFNAIDKKAIFPYLEWINEKSEKPAEFSKINNNHYQIKANLKEGEGVLVQMTADRSWKAKAGNEGINVGKDPLGFVILDTSKLFKNDGLVIINLKRSIPYSVIFGILVTIFTIGFLIYKFLFKIKIKQNNLISTETNMGEVGQNENLNK
ncbi:MAG TPA: hypothetical protein VIK81_02645 [Patescibacteria group bacterium]